MLCISFVNKIIKPPFFALDFSLYLS